MAKARTVGLVSDDLMFASQLQSAMTRVGGACALVVGDAVPDVDALFVDLNTRAGERLDLITRIRAQRPQLSIAGFCHHGERELRRRALAAGATRVINNGALQAVALRIDGRIP
jgi:DNA-binding NarL/FixJ family response regulator